MTQDISDISSTLDIDPEAIELLSAFRDRIAGAGFNLISSRDRGLIESRHIGESLAFGAWLAGRGLLSASTRVLDLGAGAGLPGLPIRIAWPSIEMTLLESSGKKAGFIQSVVADLGLEGVRVRSGRAEEIGHEEAERGSYDLVIARAIAPMNVLIEYAVPFLRAGGTLAALKGAAAQAEVAASSNALAELNSRVIEIASFGTPAGDPSTVVLVEKFAPTPERYPRRAGIPTKRPL